MNCCCACLCADPVQSLSDWFNNLDPSGQQAAGAVGMLVAYVVVSWLWDELRGKR